MAVSRQPLLIVGGSVRAAAISAARAHLQPYCVDMFADADTRALCEAQQALSYPDEMLAMVAQMPPMPWMYTGAMENHRDMVESTNRTRPLWGNDVPTLDLVRDA